MISEFYSFKTTEEYFQDKEIRINKTVGKIKDAGIFMNTTLIVDYLINEQLYEKDKFLQRPELQYMSGIFMAAYDLGEDPYAKMIKNEQLLKPVKKSKIGNGTDDGRLFMYARYKLITDMLKKLHNSDVLLLAGTDCGVPSVGIVPGYSLHTELVILTENGFSPYEAIKTATYNAGIAVEAMTGKNSIGTIEINKQADFILTTTNPLEKISNIKDMEGIMVAGRWLTKDQLDTLPVTIRPCLEEILLQAIREKGVDGITPAYSLLKRENKNYIVWEDNLKSFGYHFLNNKDYTVAIEVFKIITQEFPESEAAYYRLGLAYEKSGNTTLAIENYKKAIVINPKYKSAKKALKNFNN